MERRISLFALVATFLVLAPLCGSLLALTCPAKCCCGHNLLADPCQAGTCIRSSPAAAAGTAAVVTDAPATAPVASALSPAAVAPVNIAPVEAPAAAYSPPKLFLQNASLLI